jgi:nucleoside-diphosphate-sugar epimerase
MMNALILGATGMIGSEVLKYCLSSDRLLNVLSVGRKPTGKTHPKLKEINHDNFLDFSSLQNELEPVNIVYYCLGVYQNKVSKEDFWEITVDYQVALIKELEKTRNDITFCLFGAQGADPKEMTPILFAKAKGRAERILMESKLTQKYIFRPGFINPDNSFRNDIWVKLFQPIFRLFPFIGVNASHLGKVIAQVGIEGYEKTILENKDIRLAN